MNEFKVIRQWQAHLARIPALAFSRDGKMLISSSGDGSVKFWRVPEGTLLKSLDGYASEVSAFALFPQENALILGTAEGIVEVWSFLP
jgi:WD40 repeat protein